MRTHPRGALALALALGTSGCQLIADIQELPGPPSAARTASDAGVAQGGEAPGAAAGVSGSTGCTAPAYACDAAGGSGCCDAPPLPGGSFFRDYDAIDFTDSSNRATVSPFRLDRYEVTLGRFRGFVAAYYAGWRPAVGSGSDPASMDDGGWRADWSQNLPSDGMDLEANLECHSTLQTYRRTAGATEGQPINCVTWYLAYAFCVWDGGRLPTDSEWEFAAAGGDEQRYYPWNDAIDDAHASYFVDDQKQCFGDRVAGCTLQDLTPGGTHAPGAGKWGQEDLSGDAAEWVRDGDGDTNTDCVDCIDLPDQSGARRVRGGAFDSQPPGDLRVAAYTTYDPGTPSERIGFRCARPQ